MKLVDRIREVITGMKKDGKFDGAPAPMESAECPGVLLISDFGLKTLASELSEGVSEEYPAYLVAHDISLAGIRLEIQHLAEAPFFVTFAVYEQGAGHRQGYRDYVNEQERDET